MNMSLNRIIKICTVISFILIIYQPINTKASINDIPDREVLLSSEQLIYNENENSAQISIVNKSPSSFLIQSWVESYKKSDRQERSTLLPPYTFIVTPQLFRLDTGESHLDIHYSGENLPKDRESVFCLNVMFIPLVVKPGEKPNNIQFVFIKSVKLLWRPKGLSGNPVEAYKQLKFKRNNSYFDIINPTPYYVTISSLMIDGHHVVSTDEIMIPPKSLQHYPLSVVYSGEISFIAISDSSTLKQPKRAVLQ